jgi:hypothetical protein
MKQGPRIALLAVALGAILTLILDYLENWYRYIGAKQKLSDDDAGKRPPNTNAKQGARDRDRMRFVTDYYAVSSRVFRIKHLVGSLTLLALTLVLGMLLCQTVLHSQEDDYLTSYYGEWCGGARPMSLSIKGKQTGEVHFGWGILPEIEPQGYCVVEFFLPEEAQFRCEEGNLLLTVRPRIVGGWFGSVNLPVEWIQAGGDSGHQMLLPCNPHNYLSNTVTLGKSKPFPSNH